MKKQQFLFWVILLWVSFGLVLTGFRAYDYVTRLYYPNVSLMYLLKFLSFGCLAFIGGILFILLKNYQKSGLFDQKSVYYVRLIVFVCIAVAVFNSLAESFKNFTDGNTFPQASPLMSQFFTDFVFESPLSLFLALLTFILSSFIQKAIAVKSENESFI